jgi:ABC-2 type transport system permease protein
LFPKKLLEIAKFNPIYHMNEALLGVWASGGGLAEISLHFWFLCGFALLMIAGGWLSYQRMLKVERRF